MLDGAVVDPTTKKRKIAHVQSDRKIISKKPRKQAREIDQPDLQSQILLLESRIVESRLHYNDISTLLEYVSAQDQGDGRDITAAVALCRIFCKLMAQGSLTAASDAPENEATIVKWLLQRFQEYQERLVGLLKGDPHRQSSALTLLMRLLKVEAAASKLPERTIWLNGILTKLITAFMDCPQAGEARIEFGEKYLEQYHDIRYYTWLNLSAVLRSSTGASVTTNAISLLSTVENVPEKQEDLDASEEDNFYLPPPSNPTHKVLQLSAHKKQAQTVWVALLQRDLDVGQRRKVLSILPDQVAPWFVKPEMLLDFLTDSFNTGGAMSLMALSGLFFLMKQKNLDYPHFYPKLYSMLDANLLHSKHRSRFFRLLDTFLSSSHLPATMVASFIKRMARLALSAPPSAIVVVVPWIYNLLRGHPTCTFMIHRKGMDEDFEDGRYCDPFDMTEPDPTVTNAIESSLWEIQMLRSHYHPNVATICNIIAEQFTKQVYNLEDFLDHSYASMLDAELDKDIKKPPEIEFQIPKRIFLRQGPALGVEDRMLTKLWDFD